MESYSIFTPAPEAMTCATFPPKARHIGLCTAFRGIAFHSQARSAPSVSTLRRGFSHALSSETDHSQTSSALRFEARCSSCSSPQIQDDALHIKLDWLVMWEQVRHPVAKSMNWSESWLLLPSLFDSWLHNDSCRCLRLVPSPWGLLGLRDGTDSWGNVVNVYGQYGYYYVG